MLDFLKQTQDDKFHWADIGNVEEGRKNLGEEMPVFIYRLFQFTMKDVLLQQFGKEKTIEIFRNAGDLAGQEFAENALDLTLPYEEFIASLQKILMDSKVGVLRVERFDADTGFAVLTVGEDLDCSGLPVTGETVCNYDEGFLAGILKKYTKRNYVVTEIDCWATGSRVCRFEAQVQE